jgi:hypothetical protein
MLRDATTLKDVPAHGYRLLDVAHTSISKSDANAGKHAVTVFWIDGETVPQRLVDDFKLNAIYEFHVRIYADNAAPIEYSFRVKVGGDYGDSLPISCLRRHSRRAERGLCKVSA